MKFKSSTSRKEAKEKKWIEQLNKNKTIINSKPILLSNVLKILKQNPELLKINNSKF